MLDSAPTHCPRLDRINRRTYGDRRTVRQFANASGWLEPGERLAIEYAVAHSPCRGPVLDIGIGGGRTIPLLSEIGTDYRGIDYSAAMVDAARRRCPSANICEMDARRMTFPDDSFQLVAFSYNGIDSVDQSGRLQILAEVRRVLCPSGYFIFSTLNRHGSEYGHRWPGFERPARAGPVALLRAAARVLVGGLNWRRSRIVVQEGPDTAIGRLSAHNYGLVTVFTSLEAQLDQLRLAGFAIAAIFDPAGQPVAIDGSQATDAPWWHFVVRKRVASAPAAMPQ